MNPMQLAACVAVLAGLGACAAPPRPPADPTATLPAAWQAPLPHEGRPADLADWWRQLGDPVLPGLVEAAQAASPGLASGLARIAEARAARVAAGAAYGPMLDANASAVRADQPGQPLATTVQAGLQATWEIDLFGRGGAALAAAEARQASAQAGWHAARVSVAAETALTYVGLRACERQLAVARQDAASRAETARLVRLSAEAGFAATGTAALARASAAEGAARATQQLARCTAERQALAALTGLDDAALRARLDAPWQQPASLPGTIQSLPAEVLRQRPDLYQAEQAVAAASAEVGAARADQRPRITLAGQIGTARVQAAGVDLSQGTWSIGPVMVTLPLLDGGRRAAAEAAAVARYDEAVALYRAQVRQAVREVEEALVLLASARARQADARTAAEGYRASFTATEARQRAGLASLIELEDQRRVALAAETALVELDREQLAAWIALYRAAGGGWSRATHLTATTATP